MGVGWGSPIRYNIVIEFLVLENGNWDCGASQSNFEYRLGNQSSSQSIYTILEIDHFLPFTTCGGRREETFTSLNNQSHHTSKVCIRLAPVPSGLTG